jgi:hypothetical protein
VRGGVGRRKMEDLAVDQNESFLPCLHLLRARKSTHTHAHSYTHSLIHPLTCGLMTSWSCKSSACNIRDRNAARRLSHTRQKRHTRVWRLVTPTTCQTESEAKKETEKERGREEETSARGRRRRGMCGRRAARFVEDRQLELLRFLHSATDKQVHASE